MSKVLSILAAACLLVANMGAAPVPDHQTAQSKANRLPKPYQVGPASWYGKQFHGRTTASGENFDMFELTAAHKNLPLGSYVKVTNLRNGKWIVVRINDRGPFVGNRIVDLSYSAGRMLQMRGVEKVRLDLVQPETLASNQSFGNPQ